MRDEASITINGQDLTTAQSMAVRVAIESFSCQLETGAGLGEDLHGRLIRQAYDARLNEIRRMIFGEAPGLAHNGTDVNQTDRA